MIDIRLRSKISDSELKLKIGKNLTDSDFNLQLVGPTTVRKPDGKILCIYLPKAVSKNVADAAYATLHSLKNQKTDQRGNAGASPRVRKYAGSRTYNLPVPSTIIGAIDPGGSFRYCRLTAWTGRKWDKYQEVWPLFQEIARHFEHNVPDRYAAQMEQVRQTKPEWIVAGTPFTTITVNSSFGTGVHQDSGDLDAGFSNIAVLRYGKYKGCKLAFPEYRVGVDMKHRDLLLMDAHEWHGNSIFQPLSDDAERISIVCYFRTKMANCGSADEEREKAIAKAESHNSKNILKHKKEYYNPAGLSAENDEVLP